MIYLITQGSTNHPPTGPVKIGYSLDPDKRAWELQTGNPNRLFVFAYIPGTMQQEKSLHRLLSMHSTGTGEWYHPTPEVVNMMKFIKENTIGLNAQVLIGKLLSGSFRN